MAIFIPIGDWADAIAFVIITLTISLSLVNIESTNLQKSFTSTVVPVFSGLCDQRTPAVSGQYNDVRGDFLYKLPRDQQTPPACVIFFGVRIRLGTILGRFSIIYFRGLGLRISVRVWVRVRARVRVWVRVRIGVGVRVSVVLWSW